MTAFADYTSLSSIDNPLDLAESLCEDRDWLFDRPASEELVADIAGSWCHSGVAGSPTCR